jgi:hypothetical protein
MHFQTKSKKQLLQKYNYQPMNNKKTTIIVVQIIFRNHSWIPPAVHKFTLICLAQQSAKPLAFRDTDL